MRLVIEGEYGGRVLVAKAGARAIVQQRLHRRLFLRASATLSIPLLSPPPGAFELYTNFVVVLALLVGGGSRQGLWSDALIQLMSLPLIAWAILRVAPARLDGSGKWALFLLGAILLLPLLQLIPMPPGLWTALPGRGEIAAAYDLSGMVLPWLPVSLNPAATAQSFFSLLPAAAIFLAGISLDFAARRTLIGLALAVAFISVVLDFLQIMTGQDSALRFYTVTNTDRAVGFFANANHHAALLYFVIPFAAAWMLSAILVQSQNRSRILLLLLGLFISLCVGISLTVSRAGLALGVIAAFSSVALAWRHRRPESISNRAIIFAGLTVLIAFLVVFQLSFVSLARKAENANIVEDIRWPVAVLTSKAAIANLPFGTGLGTFSPVYELRAPLSMARERYVNHAHNDWLELWLTAGIPGLALVIGFLVWFAQCSFAGWFRNFPDVPIEEMIFVRAAPVAVCLLLIHSVVDYPLRTIALEVLFAVACVMLVNGNITYRGPKRAVHRHDI